jgi:hypothetical protein
MFEGKNSNYPLQAQNIKTEANMRMEIEANTEN